MDTRWHQIETLFNEAADISPQERNAFLDRACHGDPDLKKEVESLIAASEKSNGFMSGAIRSAAEAIITESTTPVEGERLGSYRVVREIGRGGMGAVYLAVRADDQYEKQVAIKLVKRGMDTDRVLARFRAERQILASLDHPNIARLLDGGTTADGRPYLVMEYIEGQPITTYCDAHQLGVQERCALFRHVCSAVQFAHQKLVVHRDIKPGNILVTTDGTPKLLDFGIAKLVDTRSTHQQTVGAHQLLTPDYASPEQVKGDPITTATDVYLLGGVLYELLTGRCPHVFKTSSVYEIERVICQTEVDRPSTLVNGRMRRDLAGDLDNILLTALRKEPERRYASVDHLSDDLRRYLSGLPVTARTDTIGYRTGKFVRRHALGVTAAVLLASTLTGGVISTMWQAQVAEEQRRKAEQARMVAEANQHRAEQESARAEEARLRAEREQKRAEAQTVQTLQQTEKAERRFNQVHQLASHFLFDFDEEIQKLQGSTAARRLLVKTALEYLDSLARESANNIPLRQDLAVSYEKIGDVQGNPHVPHVGDLEGALVSYQKALAIRERLPLDSVDAACDLVGTHLKMSDALDYAGRTERAMEHQQKAISLATAQLSAHTGDPRVRKQLARAYVSEADIFVKLRRTPDALDAYRRAGEVLAQLSAANPTDVTTKSELGAVYLKTATMLVRLGNDAEALAIRTKALKEHEALLQMDRTNVKLLRAVMTSNLAVGDSYTFANVEKMRNPSEAMKYYQRALEIAKPIAAADSLDQLAKKDLALCSSRVADANYALNYAGSAVKYYKDAIQAIQELLDATPSNQQIRSTLANYYARMGPALERNGKIEEAERSLRKGIQLFEQAAQADPKNLADRERQYVPYRDLGHLYFNAGRWSDALPNYAKAVELAAIPLGRDPQDVIAMRTYGEASLFLSRTLAKMGRSCSDGGKQWQTTRDVWRQIAARTILDSDEVGIDQEAATALAGCK